jgi:hypothetical protein
MPVPIAENTAFQFPARLLWVLFRSGATFREFIWGLNFRKDVCSDFFTRVWKDGCSYCRKHLFSSSRREGQNYHRRKHLPKTPFQFLAPRGTELSPPKTLAENTAFQFTCGRIRFTAKVHSVNAPVHMDLRQFSQTVQSANAALERLASVRAPADQEAGSNGTRCGRTHAHRRRKRRRGVFA